MEPKDSISLVYRQKCETSHILRDTIFRLSQIVEATVAFRDGGFILCQVPPSDHYSHYPHNGCVAFWLSVA